MINTVSRTRRMAYEWLLLLLGCVIYALSTVYVNQVEVIPGSMLGIAITANSIWGTPIGAVNLLLNVPIMIVVTKKQGLKILIYTVLIMVCTSVLIDMWAWMTPAFTPLNALLTVLIGGAGMGLGAGLLIAAGGTMAGTTALTLLLQKKLSRLRFGTILFAMDCVIMLVCAFIIRSWSAILYSAVYSFTVAKVMDIVILADGRVKSRFFPPASEH